MGALLSLLVSDLLLLLLLSHNSLAGFKRFRMPDQALVIHFSAESIQTILHVLNITCFLLENV